MTREEDYRQLTEEEAALAKVATSNETRAQHYAMAAYYARLADVKEKLSDDLSHYQNAEGSRLS